jgi:hypothetical protein
MSRKNLGDLTDLRTLIAATRKHSLDPRYCWKIAEAWEKRKEEEIADLIIARHHSDQAYGHILAIVDQIEHLQPIIGEDEDDEDLSRSVPSEDELLQLSGRLEVALNARLQLQETYT